MTFGAKLSWSPVTAGLIRRHMPAVKYSRELRQNTREPIPLTPPITNIQRLVHIKISITSFKHVFWVVLEHISWQIPFCVHETPSVLLNVKRHLRATRSLTTGIVRRQFPCPRVVYMTSQWMWPRCGSQAVKLICILCIKYRSLWNHTWVSCYNRD